MKRNILLIIFMLLVKTTLSQKDNNSYFSRFEFIHDLFKKEDFYQAMLYMDLFLADYPNDASMYFNRGLINLKMNDRNAAVADFRKVKMLKPRKKKELINFLTSKEYLVKLLTADYIDFDLLDPDHNYKPVFGLKDSLQGALRPERTCFDVYYYNLTVKILPGTKSIEGSNQIYFNTTGNTHKIQIDLFDDYTINSVQWQGKELTYNRIYNAVFINFEEMLPAGTHQMITIKYEGKPRIAPSPPWNGGFVWKKKRFSHWVGVACEHLGASSWWPCKDHLTEKPDSMQINVQVPNGYQAISNGNLRETSAVDKKYTNFKWFVSYPINSYGVTLYMGKFVNFSETVSTCWNGTCNIDYYVLPHHLETAKKYYDQTKEIVAVYQKLFGDYPYPRDGLAMVEAPYEGMEHQSAIAIGDGYGKKKRRNYEDNRYDYLVVHETAHEWWGNTVTMGDMADAWISEGFATYAELLFMEEKFGYPAYLGACSKTMQIIMNIWPMVGVRDVNDNTFLGGDIYHKGAIMLNNLRCIINNDSQFFWLIRDFYNQYKFKVATTDDFIRLTNEVTGNDNTGFFNKFLYSPEPPVLSYEYSLLNKRLKFSYQWINVDTNFTMPFTITLNDTLNYRLTGSTGKRVFKADDVNSFYMPNEYRFNKDRVPRNAFTYYWTSWKR